MRNDHFITKYDVECPDGVMSVVLEDSIMQKGRPVTAGSIMLENFISPLDATVVERLEAAGVCILGKTQMDEFGIAGLFTSEILQSTGSLADAPIPHSEFRIPNSGAVSAVAEGVADIALCNDYTGIIGQYAAAHGLYYIHPTYGTVSRYGLIPAVASMDQIGIVCKSPAEGFRVLSIIAGHDSRDGAMIANEVRNHRGQGTGNREQELGASRNAEMRVAVPQNAFSDALGSASVMQYFGNFEAVNIELKYFDVYAQVMQIL